MDSNVDEFSQAFDRLMDHMELVMTEYSRRKVDRKNIVFQHFRKFKHLYVNFTQAEKVEIVDTLYKGLKEDILKSSIEWLKHRNPRLQYYEDVVVHLGIFFNYATDISNAATEEEMLKPEMLRSNNNQSILYPDILRLYLYRLFVASVPTSSRDAGPLKQRLQEVMDDLGMNDQGANTLDGMNQTAAGAAPGVNPMAGSNFLAMLPNLMQTASKIWQDTMTPQQRQQQQSDQATLMQQAAIDGNAVNPMATLLQGNNLGQLMQNFGNAMNNPETQSKISSVIQKLQTEGIQGLVADPTSKELANAVIGMENVERASEIYNRILVPQQPTGEVTDPSSSSLSTSSNLMEF